MAHPDKESGTEQKDRIMQNFVKLCTDVLALSSNKDHCLSDLHLAN